MKAFKSSVYLATAIGISWISSAGHILSFSGLRMEIYYWSQNHASLTICAWQSQLLLNHDCDFIAIYRAALTLTERNTRPVIDLTQHHHKLQKSPSVAHWQPHKIHCKRAKEAFWKPRLGDWEQPVSPWTWNEFLINIHFRWLKKLRHVVESVP